MGQWYAFRCSCGYEATVSGGFEMGMDVYVVTITCATCKELHDAVVGKTTVFPFPGPIPEHPKCPRSRTRVHATSLWTHPGPCPKCGKEMTRGNELILWD